MVEMMTVMGEKETGDSPSDTRPPQATTHAPQSPLPGTESRFSRSASPSPRPAPWTLTHRGPGVPSLPPGSATREPAPRAPPLPPATPSAAPTWPRRAAPTSPGPRPHPPNRRPRSRSARPRWPIGAREGPWLRPLRLAPRRSAFKARAGGRSPLLRTPLFGRVAGI